MKRLPDWTTNEFVLTALLSICLSLSALFYLLAGAERTVQSKLMEHQPILISQAAWLADSSVAAPGDSSKSSELCKLSDW